MRIERSVFEARRRQARKYRDRLAKELVDAPRDEAFKILAVKKLVNDDYGRALFDVHDQRFFDKQEEKLKNILEGAASVEECVARLSDQRIILRNEQAGFDHSENIIKRMGLALTLHCPLLAPDVGDAHNIIAKDLEHRGIAASEKPDVEEYKSWLGARFPESHFSKEELDRIVEKLDVENFGSLDPDLEEMIVELNAVPGIKTQASCAGHADAYPRRVPIYYHYAYVSMIVNDAKIDTSSFEDVLSDSEVHLSEQQLPSGENERLFAFHLRQYPPDDWIRQNHKRTREEIFQDSVTMFEKKIGEPFLYMPRDAEDLANLLIKKRNALILENPRNARKPLAANSPFFQEWIPLFPGEQEYVEYEEYYRSSEAHAHRDAFFQSLENTARDMRAI